MSADNRIWIGQDGERYGPYGEDDIRQWLTEGRVTMDTLAWREGMADWAPLGIFVVVAASTPPPPLPPGMSSLQTNQPASGPFRPGIAATRSTMPEPPEMHWGLVLLLSIVTLGIFAIFWGFNQAAWVRRIDPSSNATLLLGLSIACFVIGEPLYFVGIFHSASSGSTGDSDLLGLGTMLLLARWVLYLVAYFSMAGSINRYLTMRGIRQRIGGPTLFFFPMFFMQANLSWVARWERTGQTSPKPSQAVFWIVFVLLPLALGISLGFAVAAFKDESGEARLRVPRSQDARVVTAIVDVDQSPPPRLTR